MPDVDTNAPAALRVRELTAADLADMAGWTYSGPWAVYDSDGPLNPALGYWAVVRAAGVAGDAGDVGDAEQLIGFACLGEDARVPGLVAVDAVLDVGVGLRPELVGQGLGPAYANAVLDFAAARGATTVRAVVQDWNTRSLRLCDRLGFVRTGTHDVGDVTYVVLQRSVAATPTAPVVDY